MDAPAVFSHASCRSSLAAGCNPLIDAANPLFSLAGRLTAASLSLPVDLIQKECIREIEAFQRAAENHGLRAEYVFVGRLLLCTMLDDMMAETAVGKHGLWLPYRLSLVFHPEASNEERFFFILQRILKDPIVYMDLMELMYICLSLGFKGVYRHADREDDSLNQVTNLLYKQIRLHQNDTGKKLSPVFKDAPFVLKKEAPPRIAYGQLFFVTTAVIMLLFLGLSLGLDVISKQAVHVMSNAGV